MVSAMFEFFRNMWRMGRVTEERLTVAVSKGYITSEEKNLIMEG